MTMHLALLMLPLIVLLLVAAVIDLRTRKIPNWLTLLTAVAGMVQAVTWDQALAPGWMAALGLIVGLALNLPLWLLGIRGGGDLKLFAGVGAWMGPVNVVAVFIVATVAAMLVAIVQALCQGRLKEAGARAATASVGLIHGSTPTEPDADELYARRHVPYAVPMLLAVVAMLSWS